MAKESVLVTGGAGYLGNVICRDLLDHDYSVTCLDNLMYHQEESVFPLARSPDFNFVFGDVRDRGLVEQLLKDHDIVLPLAAIVGLKACESRKHDAQTTNLEAVRMINDLRSSDQRLVYPNTNSGYGTRTDEAFCTEETPLEPISLYGTTKVEAEQEILGSKQSGVSLRLATVFGISPRMRRDLIVNDFVYRAMTDNSIVLFEASFRRNFVSIDDVARAFRHCIENYGEMQGQAYNLGLDEANMTKRELAERIKDVFPDFEILESEIGEDPDKRDYIVSNEKIRQAGFEAETQIEEGIMDLRRGYEILLRNIPNTNL